MLNLMAFFKMITDFHKIETFIVKSKDSYLGARENTVSVDDANQSKLVGMRPKGVMLRYRRNYCQMRIWLQIKNKNENI